MQHFVYKVLRLPTIQPKNKLLSTYNFTRQEIISSCCINGILRQQDMEEPNFTFLMTKKSTQNTEKRLKEIHKTGICKESTPKWNQMTVQGLLLSPWIRIKIDYTWACIFLFRYKWLVLFWYDWIALVRTLRKSSFFWDIVTWCSHILLYRICVTKRKDRISRCFCQPDTTYRYQEFDFEKEFACVCVYNGNKMCIWF